MPKVHGASRPNVFYFFSLFFLCCLALSSFLPIVRSFSGFNFIWPILIAGWLVCVLLYQPEFFYKVTTHKVLIYIFFTYTIFIAYLSGNTLLGNRYLEFTQIVIFYWAYELSASNKRIEDLIKVLVVLMPICLYTSIITLIAYIANPNISRTAKRGTTYGVEQMASGVGGYEFIYMLVFITIPLLYVIFNKRNKVSFFQKSSLFIILLIFLLNILYSNFATALIIVGFAIFLHIILKKLNGKAYSLLLIIFILFLPFLPSLIIILLDYSIGLMNESLNAKRLGEIKLLLELGVVDASIGARFDAFEHSILSVMQAPNLGLIMTAGDNDILASLGQHSFILDSFAIYGVWIGLLQMVIFFSPLLKHIQSKYKSNLTLSLSMVCFPMLFFMINNVTPSIGFAIYFVYPTLNLYILKHTHMHTFKTYNRQTSS